MLPSLKKILWANWHSKILKIKITPRLTLRFHSIKQLDGLEQVTFLGLEVLKLRDVTSPFNYNSIINSYPGERCITVSKGFMATATTLQQLMDHSWGLK